MPAPQLPAPGYSSWRHLSPAPKLSAGRLANIPAAGRKCRICRVPEGQTFPHGRRVCCARWGRWFQNLLSYSGPAHKHCRSGLMARDRPTREIHPQMSDHDLRNLVRRLLRNTRAKHSLPVIISGISPQNQPAIATGRVLSHVAAHLQVLVDSPLLGDRVTTVFLPEQVFFAEVLSCTQEKRQYALELLLIQDRSEGP
jgi:hypothetical protein